MESIPKEIIIEEKISKVNGETQIKKYTQGKMLGKGGFAKCYEITNLETKKLQAAKIIPKTTLSKNKARQKLISEIKIHKSLKNFHIVQFEHVFEDSDNVYILLELCPNQTLNELIKRRKRLTELEVQCFLQQLILAIKYMHQNKVIHRDLKLGNLFLNDKMEIKVGDFGLASKLEFEGERRRTICGTPNYIAPEILENKNGHSYEVDIWSLGVIIYTLLIGKPPFETPEVKTTYKKIRLNSYSFPDHVAISDSARNLITKILNLDPALRPKLDEIQAHEFLNQGGTIPKNLPLSTLTCMPSASYFKQFQNPGTWKNNQETQRMAESAQNPLARTIQKEKNNFMSSDKLIKTINSNEKLGNNFNWTNRPNTQKLELKPNQIQSQTNLLPIKNDIWVKSWVDYSNKYGLGYLLSNGSSGVFFNDSTKIIIDPSSTYFEYMERKPVDRQDIMTAYNMTDYPKELQKKITLLQHFKNYLDGNMMKEAESKRNNQPLVYVKKWMKTKHAIMFRLSNKIVQVNFTDKTEILLCSENKQVTYVNKNGERSNYPLASALESNNVEMSKRLKYTKEILTHMLNNNNNNNFNKQKENDE